MSQVHVCDRCGVRLTPNSCPDTRRHIVEVGSWYGVNSASFNDGGADARALDLCNDCYNQLMEFLGITINTEISAKYRKDRMHGFGGHYYPDKTEYSVHTRTEYSVHTKEDVQNG